MNDSSSTLSKNELKQFVLRIDFGEIEKKLFGNIVNSISNQFDRVEKRIIQGIKFNLGSIDTDLRREDTFDLICVSEKNGITLTFSERDGSIVFESSKYKDKDTYLGIFSNLIKYFCDSNYNFISKRIGMRFINEFLCDKKNNISKILNKRLSGNVKNMISSDMNSRVIAMEETTCEDFKYRVQYGIINKFYPDPIRVYDLLLDLDFYIDTPIDQVDLADATKKLNKSAFYTFKECMNPIYLEKLK